MSNSGTGRNAHSLMTVHPAFPLPTTELPTLQGAPKDGFGEAIVAWDMPEPCKFPSLDSCQTRFLWTHKEVDLVLHAVVSLVLKEGDRRSFLLHLDQKPGSFFQSRNEPGRRKS